MHPLLVVVVLITTVALYEASRAFVRRARVATDDLEGAVYGLHSTRLTRAKVWTRIVAHASTACLLFISALVAAMFVLHLNGVAAFIVCYFITYFTWVKVANWYKAEKASASTE